MLTSDPDEDGFEIGGMLVELHSTSKGLLEQ